MHLRESRSGETSTESFSYADLSGRGSRLGTVTREQALTALAAGEFNEFIGVEENLEVEFKGEPYALDAETGKFELAKDVSALANARGGVILLGIRTERRSEVFADTAAEVRLLRRGLVDESRYLDVVKARVYPRIDGIRVSFYPAANNADRGLVAVMVPPQEDSLKYFLIQRPIADEGPVPGWLIGVAIRSFGRVDEQRIGEIHSLLNRGLTLSQQISDVSAGLDRLHSMLSVEPSATQEAETAADRLDATIEARLDEL